MRLQRLATVAPVVFSRIESGIGAFERGIGALARAEFGDPAGDRNLYRFVPVLEAAGLDM